MSGTSAILSLVAVILVARLNSHNEHARWLREERVRSVAELKVAVSQLRVRYSHPSDRENQSDPSDKMFDFAAVNAAMARVDLVGSDATVSSVETLRCQLRQLIQASLNGNGDWRTHREAVDNTMSTIVGLVREDVL